MHCACCYVLATKNCKCHKTLWKNRQYIIKKALHAGHVWYNYFLFCFVFCFFFCLENGLLDKIWHDIIIIFFVTHHLKTKKCNLDLPLTFTSAREINNAFFFLFCFNFAQLQNVFVIILKCTDCFSSKRWQNGFFHI